MLWKRKVGGGVVGVMGLSAPASFVVERHDGPRQYTGRVGTRGVLISLIYTVMIVLLFKTKALRPLENYFHGN